jgi:hypothetical protein
MDNLSISVVKGPSGTVIIAKHGEVKIMANAFKVLNSTVLADMEIEGKRVRGFWFSLPKQLVSKYPDMTIGGALFLEQDLMHLFETEETRHVWSGYIALGPKNENGHFDTSNHEAIGIKFQAVPSTQGGLFLDSLDKMEMVVTGPYEVATSKTETA